MACWLECGRTSLDDDPPERRPKAATALETVQRAEDVVLEETRVKLSGAIVGISNEKCESSAQGECRIFRMLIKVNPSAIFTRIFGIRRLYRAATCQQEWDVSPPLRGRIRAHLAVSSQAVRPKESQVNRTCRKVIHCPWQTFFRWKLIDNLVESNKYAWALLLFFFTWFWVAKFAGVAKTVGFRLWFVRPFGLPSVTKL